jgi:DNA polymerase iota
MQEDSYIKLNTMMEVNKQMMMLSTSLIKRMRLDLTDEADDDDMFILEEEDGKSARPAISSRRWIAHPRTLRLTTRPRPPRNPDGSRSRLLNRISKSSDMPSFIHSLVSPVEALAEKLVNDALVPLFRQLHPEKSGWDLSLVNICATNMAPMAAATRGGAGRDISRMFKRQDNVLKEWRVEDVDLPPSPKSADAIHDDPRPTQRKDLLVGARSGSEDMHSTTQEIFMEDEWSDEQDTAEYGYSCPTCGAVMPSFAMVAHQRFVSLNFHIGRLHFRQISLRPPVAPLNLILLISIYRYMFTQCC